MDEPEKILISSEELFQKLSEAGPKPEKITIIFGAGASYGYSRNLATLVPPIVLELFEDINPVVNQVIHREEHANILNGRDFTKRTLTKTYKGDLEKYLSSLYDGDDDDNIFSALLMYIQDVCDFASKRININQNNYKDLCDKLRALRGRRPWSCITFNYDTLFERSYISTGRDPVRDFSNMAHYNEGNPRVLKMHGSVNFRYLYKEIGTAPVNRKSKRDIFNLMMKKRLVNGSSTVVQSTSLDIGDFLNSNPERSKDGHLQVADNYNFPLMMIPIHATKKSENPFFETMLDEARKEIEASSLVIAIGYNFGDELFCEKIKGLDVSKKELIVVDIQKFVTDLSQGERFKHLSSIWSGPIRVFNGNGFTDFIEAII